MNRLRAVIVTACIVTLIASAIVTAEGRGLAIALVLSMFIAWYTLEYMDT